MLFAVIAVVIARLARRSHMILGIDWRYLLAFAILSPEGLIILLAILSHLRARNAEH
jgi:hypothetical protein